VADETTSFSVAVATAGRTDELADLLTSIERSSIKPTAVIIVDQNADDRLSDILARFPSLGIEHHRVPVRGLSAAKNYAASVASSAILFTPDDDCRVLPDTFQIMMDELKRTGADAVFGRCFDETGADSVTRYVKTPGWLARGRFEGMFVEPATAVRTQVVRQVPFDETLGVGTFHGAEEGYDWVLRLLAADKRLYFQPAAGFFHPRTIVDHGSPTSLRRVFTYRCGFARVCRKHGLWGKYARRIALVSAGIVAYLITDRGKARYYLAELSGLIAGAIIEP